MPRDHAALDDAGALAGQTDPASIGLAEAMGAGNMETKTLGHLL